MLLLDCLSCHNKILQTQTTKFIFLTVLEARSPRSKCQQILFLVKALPGLQMATYSLCPHMAFSLYACGESSSVSLSFIRTLISLDQSPTLMPLFNPLPPKGPNSKYDDSRGSGL